MALVGPWGHRKKISKIKIIMLTELKTMFHVSLTILQSDIVRKCI
jgi:hypothetical protein